MAKSIIVYGVPGGKTRFAQRIANYFGVRLAPQSLEDSGLIFPFGRLYFSNKELEPENYKFHARSFQSVADEINATISLTDWQSGPPPMVGEWNASPNKDAEERRWWDGYDWSCWYYKDESQESQNDSAAFSGAFKVDAIQWRGLSSEPIKVTE